MAEQRKDPRIVALNAGGQRETAYEPGARRRTLRGAISRDRILDAALALIWEGGYPALSISAVCKRAEVSAASLYHHFGDKAGLMSAMIEASLVYASEAFIEFVDQETRPLARLERYVLAMRELGKDYRTNTIGVLSTLAEGAAESPELAAAIGDARRRAWRFTAAEMCETVGVTDGLLFAHLQFAFATYIIEVAKSKGDRAELRALYDSFSRCMVMTAAAVNPALLHEPEFAAAAKAASEADLLNPPRETDHD